MRASNRMAICATVLGVALSGCAGMVDGDDGTVMTLNAGEQDTDHVRAQSDVCNGLWQTFLTPAWRGEVSEDALRVGLGNSRFLAGGMEDTDENRPLYEELNDFVEAWDAEEWERLEDGGTERLMELCPLFDVDAIMEELDIDIDELDLDG